MGAAATDGLPALELRDVSKTYGRGATAKRAVRDVSLSVRTGEVYGFLGPNGAGKSTTIRMALGLIRPSSGEVRLLGRDVAERGALRLVGSLVDGGAFYPFLSGRDNLRVLARTHGADGAPIDALLERVDLSKDANRKVKGYSLGMKQRLGVAAALLNDPELVIFDEPTNGLDAAGILDMRTLIRGLADDGKLGGATRAALNVPAAARLDQIEANLERWRWLPHALPPARIEVDVAGQTVTYLQADCEALSMKAVVGDPTHRTPMFASQVEAVTFNPPWNVPASIAQAEILPKAAKHPGYLAANDFIFVEGRLQQKAGPKSALGQIKFELPSPFGVYLHDTPAKALFARSRRTLSHGCMRLEKPQALAEALLGPQGWSPDAVAQAMAAGRTQAIALRAPLPLYVLYWTAEVPPDGRARFGPDVYGWDKELLNALAKADPAASAPAADCGPGLS